MLRDESGYGKWARSTMGLYLLALLVAFGARVSAQEVAVPRVTDPKLHISLVASEPEIVTPTGLAADRYGRLYVVESNTHSRDPQYRGPSSDRIVVFEDADGDGRLDKSRSFADGLQNALAIAFSNKEELYVVQMKSVVILRDKDNDGKCDSQEPVITIETNNNNNHGVLLALAFDNQNRLHVSLGNIGGSAYSISGTDGSTVSGQGDSGLIVRCGADGASLEKFAHGFWNSCELKFDAAGRLLATDNDPDARGPNRVLHIIEGGEYGYKSRFGGSGLHPYCAWNGELPGTLPMLAGVGEAPVGLLDCNTSALPEEYANDLLVGVWGTNQVVRVRTKQRGVSLEGKVEPLVIGDASFRPTSITATADGTVYIADWADRKYPVHGKGRIWRLGTNPGVKSITPQLPFSKAAVDLGETQLTALRNASTLESFDQLIEAATQSDPFAASTALKSLGQPIFRQRVARLLDDDRAPHRLIALLALRKARVPLESARLEKLLNDADVAIRRMAMIWIGETMRLELAKELKRSMPMQSVSAELFETYLATSQLLTDSELKRVRAKTPGGQIDRSVDQNLIREVLADDQQPADAKAMAVRFVTEIHNSEVIGVLSRLASSGDRTLAVEAIRTLAFAPDAIVSDLLSAVAHDVDRDVSLRCEAIMAFAAAESRNPDALLPLLADANPKVSLTVARALTQYANTESVRKEFSRAIQPKDSAALPPPLDEQLRFALGHVAIQRPQTDEQRMSELRAEGDPEGGRRVFFDRRVSCAKCHSVEGRGGRIGPDLTNVTAAKTQEQLLSSILHPNEDKSPDYQGYIVLMKDGQVYKGTQFHFRGESAEMQLENGKQLRFKLSDTQDYRPLETSLMPEKLVELMTENEFRDLFAFLTAPRVAL